MSKPAILNGRRALFVGIARDCAPHLPNVLGNLSAFASLYAATAFVFGAGDCEDNTSSVLKSWLNEGRQGVVLELGNMRASMPQRTVRLAAARNACLAEAFRRGWRDYDHLIVADLDDVMSAPVSASAFAAAATWLEQAPARAGVFANSAPRYYDVWSLRHDEWCPGDCWHAIWYRDPREPFEKAKIREVFARQIVLPASLPPVTVRSAFGGLGLYKAGATRQAIYRGLDDAGREVSEHVSFNTEVRRAGGELQIFPPLVVRAPPEHLYQSSDFALRWRMKMYWQERSQKRMPPWQALAGSPSLPSYAAHLDALRPQTHRL